MFRSNEEYNAKREQYYKWLMGRALSGGAWLIPSQSELHQLHKRSGKWDDDDDEDEDKSAVQGGDQVNVAVQGDGQVNAADDDNKDQLEFENMLLKNRARGVLDKKDIDEARSYWRDHRDTASRRNYEHQLTQKVDKIWGEKNLGMDVPVDNYLATIDDQEFEKHYKDTAASRLQVDIEDEWRSYISKTLSESRK
jgi:hypothetical protein